MLLRGHYVRQRTALCLRSSRCGKDTEPSPVLKISLSESVVSYMKCKKTLYVVVAFLMTVFGIFMLINHFEATVSCVPNEDNSAIQMITKYVTIDEIDLKYNNGILQVEQGLQLLSIHSEGVEYVRVYYTDRNSTKHHVDFEIVISENNAIGVSKLNALGQQIEYHTY